MSPNAYIDEENLIKKVEERVKYKVVQGIIQALEEQFYPPEDMIREEFIKEVENAEKEHGKVFKNAEELKQYLKNLEK